MKLKKRDLIIATAGVLAGMTIGATGLVWASTQDMSDMNNHWASKAVHYLSERGILKGYADHTFKPGNTVSRAELQEALKVD